MKGDWAANERGQGLPLVDDENPDRAVRGFVAPVHHGEAIPVIDRAALASGPVNVDSLGRLVAPEGQPYWITLARPTDRDTASGRGTPSRLALPATS